MTEHFKYEDMTDEELIDQLREGDRQVMDYICDKYKNLVRSKAKSMYILGGDSEDLIQEGMIGLFKAVQDYDPKEGASFSSFAGLCVSRQMYTAIKASQRKKHLPLNSYVSIYASASDNPEENGLCRGRRQSGSAPPVPPETTRWTAPAECPAPTRWPRSCPDR